MRGILLFEKGLYEVVKTGMEKTPEKGCKTDSG